MNCDVEVLLYFAHQYYGWYFLNTTNIILESLSSLQIFHDEMYNASFLLKDQTELGFGMLGRACDHFRPLIAMQPLRLLIWTLSLFGASTWKQFPDVKDHVLRFMAAMAMQTLPKCNPLIQV